MYVIIIKHSIHSKDEQYRNYSKGIQNNFISDTSIPSPCYLLIHPNFTTAPPEFHFYKKSKIPTIEQISLKTWRFKGDLNNTICRSTVIIIV